MRIGIDIRTMQTESGSRGIGYYLRGLVSEVARQAAPEDEFVFFLIDGRSEPAWHFLPEGLTGRWRAVAIPEARHTKARWVGRIPRLRRYQNHAYRYMDRRSLSRAVRSEKLDLLHLPSLFEPEFFADGGFPCPTVKTCYDLIRFLDIYPGHFEHLAPGFRYLLWKQLPTFASADAVVAISNSAREDLEKMVPRTRGKTHVIYPGINSHLVTAPPESREDVRRRLKLGRRYFLFSGAADGRKNLDVAIAALGIVYESCRDAQDVQLVVKGKIGEQDLIRIASWAWKAGLPPGAVKLPGFVADDDLPALYSGAVALVFPSRYEGFGLPVVEAMKCSCPVITVRNSSLVEAAGEAALLIDDSSDVEALADAMQTVMRRPDLADQMRARGLAQASRFTWEAAAEQHWRLYRGLAGLTEVRGRARPDVRVSVASE